MTTFESTFEFDLLTGFVDPTIQEIITEKLDVLLGSETDDSFSNFKNEKFHAIFDELSEPEQQCLFALSTTDAGMSLKALLNFGLSPEASNRFNQVSITELEKKGFIVSFNLQDLAGTIVEDTEMRKRQFYLDTDDAPSVEDQEFLRMFHYYQGLSMSETPEQRLCLHPCIRKWFRYLDDQFSELE